MTLAAFLKECDVNPGSYYRFMSLSGADNGCANNIYYGASLFFYRRERRAKLDKKKQKASDRKRKTTEQREGKAKKAKAGASLLERIQEVELEDEGEDGYPPVYDDCDDIRKKITFLGEKLVTQTAFLKALGNMSASSLRGFMNMKRGPGMGAANVVYRKGYVFFEKKRILEGSKKTKKRLDNEAKQGPNGFELRHDDGKRYYLVTARIKSKGGQ